jgi:hypothetical protein
MEHSKLKFGILTTLSPGLVMLILLLTVLPVTPTFANSADTLLELVPIDVSMPEAQVTVITIDDGCPNEDPPGFIRRAPPDQDAWICISAQNIVHWAKNNDALYVRTNANPVEWVKWRPTIQVTGWYKVEVSIPSYQSNASKTQQAHYTVYHAKGSTSKTINQESTAGTWQSLGTFKFNAGTSGYVYLESSTPEDPLRLLAADAARFTFVNRPPNVPRQIAPSNGSATTNPDATLQVQDTGDPDNYPWNYRNYFYRVEKTDGTWSEESGWTTNTSWTVTLPSAGAYRWRARSGDGELPSSWTDWWTFSYQAPLPPQPKLTRSHLYVDNRNYLVLEFCGTNIHQDVYIGSKRNGRDFGIHPKRVDFGPGEQCATDNNLADGKVLPSTTYQTGVALKTQDVYRVCSSSAGLCDNIKTPPGQIVDPPSPPPSGPCPVPFYWQGDPRWASNNFGTCTCTIGGCGCALTSLSMLFKYYGVNQDPGSLASCLGRNACPLAWSAACSDGKVDYNGWPAFDWSKLEDEIRHGRPVILQLDRTGGMHFVLAVSGSGNRPEDYLVNDPALKQGTRVRLNAVLARRNYWPASMRLFSGTPYCQASIAGEAVPTTPPPALNSLPTEFTAQQSTVLSTTQIITGTIIPYRNTETDMTLELSATSSAGTVTQMLIWTDSISNTTWQPYAQYVELPLCEEYFVQFRDDAGNVSVPISTPVDPVESPSQRSSLYLPLILR